MTEPRFLFDSNICIYVLEGVGERLRMRVEDCAPGEVVTSAIAYAEVMRGIRSDDLERSTRAQRMFAIFNPLPFDEVAARSYRSMPFRRGGYDRLIAAHALSLDLILITNNVRDFADVPRLRVQNWTA
ncbi:type II toxin-antitoxin system VapC family toxin [Sphingomonas montanisoli]|uniref:Ribonuclease VapC n=1 Tax=Sphingomonas montanisoli TaxID=2606412 RepID=A0A5D9CBI6_9SPHN|nr:type II toxin-antitoxin system VapC family toxin [Sphingomonas montanisoli]TZG27481.1 type II toxin-antitoxin system VapC family toxin [Sphingomonas montanisoli]